MPRSAGGLWYDWHGPADGAVVVLSPGMGGSAGYWEPNLAALSARYRVLLYDHRGTGRSDRSLPDDVTIRGMADDLLALLQELDIKRPHFIGHALGGLIGLDIASMGDILGKLVVVNGWATPDPHFERCFDTRLALLQNSGAAAYVRAQPFFLYPANWISDNFSKLEAESAHQIAHFPGTENLEKRIAAARAFVLETDIDSAVLVIAAEDDMLVPSNASRRLMDRLPGGSLAMVPWGGHACNVTDPAAFNQLVLDFLGS